MAAPNPYRPNKPKKATKGKEIDDSKWSDSARSEVPNDGRAVKRLSPAEKALIERRKLRARVRADFGGWARETSSTRNIVHVDDSVSSFLKSLSLDQGVDESRLADAWDDIVGDFIGQNTKPVSLKKGYLRLQVLQPSMRFHLEQEKGRILKKLQAELGKSKVRVIQFVLG